jgi:hypothetical protein
MTTTTTTLMTTTTMVVVVENQLMWPRCSGLPASISPAGVVYAYAGAYDHDKK